MEANTEEQLTLFAADSHANRSALPGSKEAIEMTVTSGLRCYESYGKFSQLGSLVKTLLASKAWHSTSVYLTWKVTGSRSKCLIFRLAESVPSTGATGSGLLPTPTSAQGGGERSADRAGTGSLNYIARSGMLPTPTATDYGSNKSASKGSAVRPSLQSMVRHGMLPTPMARDYRTSQGPREGHQLGLNEAAVMLSTPTTQDASNNGGPSQHNRNTKPLNAQLGGRLNPRFVEQMMGFPTGWTDLELSETQSYRR